MWVGGEEAGRRVGMERGGEERRGEGEEGWGGVGWGGRSVGWEEGRRGGGEEVSEPSGINVPDAAGQN